VLLDIKAPHWFDARDIEYRLLYENPLKLRNYARSHWAAAPALLLSQRLRQQLGLPGVGGQIAAGCVLRFELQEFSQVFDTPQRSRGILQGQAGLLDTRRQLVAERRLAIEQPAPTADAQGGVIALVAVSAELGREFAAWLNDLEKRGRLKGCRSTAGESPSH
jgi:cholesterol transport system auxiliary component